MYSLIAGLVGGFISGFIAIMVDPISNVAAIITFFLGVLIAGIISGKDSKFLYRVVGLVIFYVVAALSMFIHTVVFQSGAIWGWLGLIFYSIFIIPLYFIVGIISNKIFKRT